MLAAVYGGAIYISSNSGSLWEPASAGTGLWYVVSSSADGSRLAASMFYPHLIFSSTDAGKTWVTNSFVNEMVSLRCSADGSRLMAGDSSGNVLAVSTNSGANWSPATSVTGYPNSIAASADGAHWAATSLYGVFTSANFGATWKPDSQPGENWQSIASSADGSHLLACTYQETNDVNPQIPSYYQHLYTSTNFGATWVSNRFLSKNLSTASTAFSSVASSADGSKLVAAINPGGIWVAQDVPRPQLGLSASAAGAKIHWTVPSTNLVLQQSADSQHWTTVTNTPALNLTNLENDVQLAPTTSVGFFRLNTP